jgi:hypothetical protein
MFYQGMANFLAWSMLGAILLDNQMARASGWRYGIVCLARIWSHLKLLININKNTCTINEWQISLLGACCEPLLFVWLTELFY